MIENIRRGVAAAAVAGAVVALAACSSSGTGSGGHNTAPPQKTAPPQTSAAAPTADARPSDTTSSAAEPNTLSVTAQDGGSAMTYDISGTPHPGLVTITFANKGKYAHEMGVSMMKPGVTLEQVKTALGGKNGEQEATKLLENPEADYPVPAIVGPGGTETDVATLAAGHYVVVCFLPGPDGMPHALMGMIGEFTVDGDDSTAEPPQTDGTVELTDKGITVPDGFGTGGTFEVKNTGTKVHDFSVAKLAGKPLPDLFQCVGGAFANGTMIDKCPGTMMGGVEGLAPGTSAYVTLTLPAGQYGYVSTQGDGADMQAGLAGTFTIG
jgi:hypothetical protein